MNEENQMISVCGLDCFKCNIFQATPNIPKAKKKTIGVQQKRKENPLEARG